MKEKALRELASILNPSAKLPEGETLNFKSGGYIQIDVPKINVDFKNFDIEEEFRDEWDEYKMWDLQMKNPEETYRAYSMANYPEEKGIIMLNVRIATPPPHDMTLPPGIMSSYIFRTKTTGKVDT